MISKRDMVKNHILLIIFLIGLITSHYGLSYLILLFGLMGYIFMSYILKYKSTTYNYDFLIIYTVFALSWYMYASSGSAFETIVNVASHIYNTMFTEVLTTKATAATTLAVSVSRSVCGQILRVLYLTSQFFILVGFVKILIKRVVQRKETGFYEEYMALSVICFAILAASVITSSTGMNISRLYHIVSIVLAPFCVIGGVTVFKMLAKVVRISWANHSVKSSLKVLSVFFAIFLLFNTGWVYEVAKDHPGSISISQEEIKKYWDAKKKVSFYDCYIQEQDIFSAKWLLRTYDNKLEVYADRSSCYRVLRSYGMIANSVLLSNNTNINLKSYVYLRTLNVIDGLMLGEQTTEREGIGKWMLIYNTTVVFPLLENKIYSNGGSEIYRG
jgi:uncharacterized membrane protein